MFEATYARPAYLDAPVLCEECDCLTARDDMETKKRCKRCHAKRRAEWYQANKEACNARKRRWCQRNPEKVAEHRRRYYLKTRR